MLGQLLLAASRSGAVRRAVSGFPLTKKVVQRFVAGEGVQEARAAIERLRDAGLAVTVDHLGEETLDARAAED
ncbi:proline dehydrogenase, partial [Nonomuraea sp. NPDC004297]